MKGRSKIVFGFVLFVAGVSLGYLMWGMPPASKVNLYVAPYSTTTHPCFTHDKKNCEAEYPNTSFKYKVLTPNGRLVTEGTTSTDKTGFFELVLDSNSFYWLIVGSDKGVSTVPISTHEGYADCITYAHLQIEI